MRTFGIVLSPQFTQLFQIIIWIIISAQSTIFKWRNEEDKLLRLALKYLSTINLFIFHINILTKVRQIYLCRKKRFRFETMMLKQLNICVCQSGQKEN